MDEKLIMNIIENKGNLKGEKAKKLLAFIRN